MYCRMIATVSLVNMHHLTELLPWLRGKEPTCNTGDTDDVRSIPGLGRSPGGGHGNPLQYSCLENPMDRGIWQATVHRIARSCQVKKLCACTQPRHSTRYGCCMNNRTKEGKESVPLVTVNQTDKYTLRTFQEKSDEPFRLDKVKRKPALGESSPAAGLTLGEQGLQCEAPAPKQVVSPNT